MALDHDPIFCRCESRFQRLRFLRVPIPGALPQADLSHSAVGAEPMHRFSHNSVVERDGSCVKRVAP